MRSFCGAVRYFAAAVLASAVMTGCGPSTPEECLERASQAAAGADWNKVLKYSSRAVELAPGNIEALLFQAEAARRCGKPELAQAAASRAVNLDPGCFAARYTLGRVCMDDPARSGDALRSLLHALKLRGGDRDTLVLLCNLAVEVNSPNTVTFLRMLQRDPEFANNPVLYNQLGVAYLRRGDVANARRAFANAWKYGRNDPVITYNTACFFDRFTDSGKAAAELYRRYLQLAAGDDAAAATRALALARLGELDKVR